VTEGHRYKTWKVPESEQAVAFAQRSVDTAASSATVRRCANASEQATCREPRPRQHKERKEGTVMAANDEYKIGCTVPTVTRRGPSFRTCPGRAPRKMKAWPTRRLRTGSARTATPWARWPTSGRGPRRLRESSDETSGGHYDENTQRKADRLCALPAGI